MSKQSGGTGAGADKATALAEMDLYKIMRAYIKQMIETTPGYKGLLLDKDTMRACSTMFGRTELAEHNVVHVERIDSNDSKERGELKGIVFVRPTRENITLLKRELRQPRYETYYLFFSNLVSPVYLQDLAEVDSSSEKVQSVQEFYGDFIVVDPCHFQVPCAHSEMLLCPKTSVNSHTATEYEVLDRFVQGLSALFLAIRRRPVIRYQRGSDHAYRLADSLYSLTYKQQFQVFDFGTRSTPVVLILDRKDDPVTPLLTQWTYQAMVHELIGITDNTVKLTGSKVTDQFREIVVDTRTDDFFARHMYSNYGDVAANVKELVEKFQTQSAKHRQVDTLEDMRRFVMEHSDFQKVQSNVSKHVNLVGQLSEVVSQRNLMEVSMAEQEVANPAANLTSGTSFDEVARLVRSFNVKNVDKIRLVMLYSLRFETDSTRVRQLLDYLASAGVKEEEPGLFAAAESILKYGGADQRAGDLYGSRSLLHKAKNLVKGLQGVDNVYTQHTPLLSETISQVAKSELPVQNYPYLAGTQEEAMAWQASYKKTPPKELIVFIIGGSTYEEAKTVAEWNKTNANNCRVILGGNTVLNSKQFLEALSGGQISSSNS